MKVLVFTHKSDIDGMGGAVLANLAFKKAEYVLCETFNLQQEITKFYDSGRIYDYDLIFVTDLWLMEPMLSKIAGDARLQNKFWLFDHHESALTETPKEYRWMTIKIEDKKGLCSGTSLFYEYLKEHNYLKKQNKVIYEFVELTRKYDTWEWMTKYNEERAHELTLLFEAVGCDNYIKLMVDKLESPAAFTFNEFEKMLIENKKKQTEEKIINYSKKIYIKEIRGLKAGIVFINYEYRNDLAEYLRKQKMDIDFVMLVAMDYGTISYRSIKEGVNVRKIAEYFGGKGHDKAASSPIKAEILEQILTVIIGDK